MQALALFCQGQCFKKIAGALDISPDAVSCDIKILMKRYGVTTHAQLGVYAERNGMVGKP